VTSDEGDADEELEDDAAKELVELEMILDRIAELDDIELDIGVSDELGVVDEVKAKDNEELVQDPKEPWHPVPQYASVVPQ